VSYSVASEWTERLLDYLKQHEDILFCDKLMLLKSASTVRDKVPLRVICAIKTDDKHILKFEYLVNMFYNEHCDHFESDKYIYIACGNWHFPSVFLK
jgi:hypothetical protein